MGIALRDHSEAQAKDVMRQRVLRVVQVLDRRGEDEIACVCMYVCVCVCMCKGVRRCVCVLGLCMIHARAFVCE